MSDKGYRAAREAIVQAIATIDQASKFLVDEEIKRSDAFEALQSKNNTYHLNDEEAELIKRAREGKYQFIAVPLGMGGAFAELINIVLGGAAGAAGCPCPECTERRKKAAN